MKSYKLAPVCVALLLAAASTGCNKLRARDQLNKGVGAFRDGQFQAATDHFQQAASLDPTLVNARLYLAMAYFQQYVPNGETADNVKMAQRAIDAFNDVLKIDPSNTTALATIGQIYYYLKDFQQAKQYQLKRQEIEPNNPEPYYWIGQLNWDMCEIADRDARQDDPKLRIPDKDGNLPPLPEKKRTELAAKNGALIDEAIKSLQKAVDLKPNYSDAMAYLNLVYRQKADTESDSDARLADLKSAQDWFQKAVNARKAASGEGATPTS